MTGFDSLGIQHTAAAQHIAVVGAGIVGCATAFHLRRMGVQQVTLIDPMGPGGSTTSAGAGFVSHWSAGMVDMGAEGLRLQQYGLDFYRALSAVAEGRGQDIGYRNRGTLMLSLTPEGHDRHIRPVLESPHAPPEMRGVTPAQIAEMTAGLVDGARLYSGAFNPHGIQLETDRAITLLGQLVQDEGVDFLPRRVTAMAEDASGVTLTLDQGSLHVDQVVLAGGAWNNALLAAFGYAMPLLRVVATRIRTEGRGLPAVSPTIQCRELRLWLRECFGAVLWGTGVGYRPWYQLQGEGTAAPQGRQSFPELLEILKENQRDVLEGYFPPLRGAGVEQWVQGIACYTPDNNLIVGRVPGTSRVTVAGGDNESGVSHGPGMGRLAAEIATARATITNPHRFRPERFDKGQFPTEAAVAEGLAQHQVLRFTPSAA
ncbi:NAD(P)/FAD-dependent oxidoreductase [Ketogulonicigenium vulgare]|uniref:NAD(P)/FAD-dependent oxidoreductase n=1 Tax=Ketogulonicigenium vulgare TaxID=92945 RepID=UPI0023585349|nr:FAD-binding oxidoreductase [Ketogulonicigenium vulgare]